MRSSVAMITAILAFAPAIPLATAKNCAFFYTIATNDGIAASHFTWLLQACRGIGGNMDQAEWDVPSFGDIHFCGVCRGARTSTRDHTYNPDKLGQISLRCGDFGFQRCSQ
ncbi:hypothetical protein BKA63DRAFT_497609 [Paraphoma chrysanthemicola]|nr:hypothetical protein BKA63DRAFT_497609 [Paraphoma chrysanthemicola]